MTLEPIIVAVAALGTLAVVATFIVRGHEIGWDLSAETIFVLYVRVASLAATLVVAFGLADLLRAWLLTAPLPVGFTPVRTPQAEEVVRGATLVVAGVAFWTLHYLLPRPSIPGATLLYQAFVIVGTLAFGIATVVTLPSGVAPEIQRLFGAQAASRADGTLGGGLAGLILWLGHLWQLRAHVGRGPRREFTFGPPSPPLEPSGVGAPRIVPPGSRSAGAAAIPPADR